MSRHEHLPLFIKIYDLIKVVYRLIKQFPKEYKYTLGIELQKLIWEILDRIIEVNSVPNADKGALITDVSRRFDMFKIRLRFAYELGLLSSNKFGYIQENVEEIARMINSWKKWANKSTETVHNPGLL